MPTKSWPDYFSLWLLFVSTALLVLISIEAGYRLAEYRRRRSAHSGDAPVSSAIGGTLGLLAFLLAFTFGMTASRFDARRQLLLDEVNAIGTCYLRVDFVPESKREQIRNRLREYVHVRAELANHPQTLQNDLVRSEKLLDEMWKLSAQVGQEYPTSEMLALYVDSLNSVIDFHTKRTVVGRYRIPNIIWNALYLVSILSMAGVGYQFGLAGRRDLAVSLLLCLAFSVVIGLIADLERGFEGTMQVDQQPMVDLDRQLSADSGAVK